VHLLPAEAQAAVGAAAADSEPFQVTTHKSRLAFTCLAVKSVDVEQTDLEVVAGGTTTRWRSICLESSKAKAIESLLSTHPEILSAADGVIHGGYPAFVCGNDAHTHQLGVTFLLLAACCLLLAACCLLLAA
jgi:hypothetical protein